MSKAEIVNTIQLPEAMRTTQLLFSQNRLIILGSRYSDAWSAKPGWVDRSQRTIVAIYDTTDKKNLKLLSFRDVDGSYDDARLV